MTVACLKAAMIPHTHRGQAPQNDVIPDVPGQTHPVRPHWRSPVALVGRHPHPIQKSRPLAGQEGPHVADVINTESAARPRNVARPRSI